MRTPPTGGLYSPGIDPTSETLQIQRPVEDASSPRTQSRRARPPRHRSKTFDTYEQSIEYADHNLCTLLCRFGKIIPEWAGLVASGQASPALSQLHSESWLELSFISFSSLHRVASIKIVWVDCLSLHMEFDSHAKTLKLFRLPSICLALCISKKCPLSQ